MNIKKIIKEELADWDVFVSDNGHTVRDWLNIKELLDFLVKVYGNTDEENVMSLSGDISYDPNNGSHTVRLINEPINVLEIWPNVSRTAHSIQREVGDKTKGLLIIEFINGTPPELKRRAKIQGKRLGYAGTILLGSTFSDYNLTLSY